MVFFIGGNMIEYIEQDLLKAKPKKYKPTIIAHGCNNIGLWGAGFMERLGVKYPQAKTAYLRNTLDPGRSLSMRLEPGNIQRIMVSFDPMVIVMNMVTQIGVQTSANPTPFEVDYFSKCVDELLIEAKKYNATIRFPRYNAGFGDDWEAVEQIINDKLVANGIDVEVYML